MMSWLSRSVVPCRGRGQAGRRWYNLGAGSTAQGGRERMAEVKQAHDGISVVIPCLNEEASIGQTVQAALAGIKASGLPGEVIVVDNGSTDRSATLAAAAGARVLQEAHRGYGSALRKGFDNARHSILAMGDGDLS